MSRRGAGADPDFVEAVHELVQARRFAEARAMCDVAEIKAPDHAALAFMRGVIELEENGAAVALPHFRRALDLGLDSPAVRNDIGICLRRLGEIEPAIEEFTRALEAAPKDALIRANLAAALNDAGRHDDAIAAYRQALLDNPDHHLARSNLSKLLTDLGRTRDALPHLETLVERAGDGAYRVALATRRLPVVAASIEEQGQAWDDYERAVADLDHRTCAIDPARLTDARTNFLAAYQGRDDRANQERIAAFYRRNCPALTFRAPHVGRAPAGRPRIGFVSKNFRNHTVGKLMRGIIRRLSRDRFDVTVFSAAPVDDEIGRDIAAAAERHIVLPEDVRGAQAAIAAAEPDILYYADIGMDALTYFLAFARLATVQWVGWGHPETTGIDTVDGFISSRLLEPDGADAHYSERLVRLDMLPVYLHRPREAAAPQIDFPSGTRYLCVQSAFKFHPAFDPILERILAADSGASLTLIAGRPAWTEIMRARWRDRYPRLGERARFIPRQHVAEFLGLIRNADVILDTPHFSGGLSSAEAFAMGKAVVTLPGEFMRGRVTAGYYRQMGIEDAIAADAEDYVELAVALGRDAERRAELEARIRERGDLIFERAEAVRALENRLEDHLAAALA